MSQVSDDSSDNCGASVHVEVVHRKWTKICGNRVHRVAADTQEIVYLTVMGELRYATLSSDVWTELRPWAACRISEYRLAGSDYRLVEFRLDDQHSPVSMYPNESFTPFLRGVG